MIVLIRPEGDDLTPLRILAHIENGDQVIYDGALTHEPWWDDWKDEIYQALREREVGL